MKASLFTFGCFAGTLVGCGQSSQPTPPQALVEMVVDDEGRPYQPPIAAENPTGDEVFGWVDHRISILGEVWGVGKSGRWVRWNDAELRLSGKDVGHEFEGHPVKVVGFLRRNYYPPSPLGQQGHIPGGYYEYRLVVEDAERLEAETPQLD